MSTRDEQPCEHVITNEINQQSSQDFNNVQVMETATNLTVNMNVRNLFFVKTFIIS